MSVNEPMKSADDALQATRSADLQAELGLIDELLNRLNDSMDESHNVAQRINCRITYPAERLPDLLREMRRRWIP